MRKINKILVLLVLPVLLCGCSATYNLHITKNYLNEEIIIDDDVNFNMTKEEIEHTYPNLTIDYQNAIEDDDINNLEEGMEIYNRNIEKLNNGYKIKYSYDKFTRNNIAKSNIARTGFNNIGYLYDIKNNIIQVSTNKNMKAFDEFPNLNNVTINITTDYKVKDNNADSINGNTYTWNINRENRDRNILLVMEITDNNSDDPNSSRNPSSQKEESSSSSKKEDEEQETTSWFVILGFLGVFVIVLLILFKLKK